MSHLQVGSLALPEARTTMPASSPLRALLSLSLGRFVWTGTVRMPVRNLMASRLMILKFTSA